MREACAVADGRRHIRNRSFLRKRRARRSATPSRRNAAPITWRIVKRAAGRRSFAAMPAKTCRACLELPERSARGRSAGRACSDDRQAGRSRAGQICRARGCNDGSAEIRRAKGRGPTPRQPTSAQISAIRSACRSDYPKVCAGVPTGGAPALQCLEKNKAKLSAACGNAVAAASGGGAAAPAAAARSGSGGRSPRRGGADRLIVLRPMGPREELFVMRSACGADVRSICGGVAPGGGRIMQCLATKPRSFRLPARMCWRRSPRSKPRNGMRRRYRVGGYSPRKARISLNQPHRQRDIKDRHHDLVRNSQLSFESL